MQIGEKLRQLRIRRNLTQGELADRCELSKGFISQVERDLASPSIATLVDLLESLGSDLKTFFTDDNREKLVFSPSDLFEKSDDEEKHGKITWLIPTAQKNKMEPILLELQPGGESGEMPPHEGEEFGYVLAGRITLMMGDNMYHVKTGGSFCIHPETSHSLKNAGKTKAKILWVSTPPSF
ncbi:MAG: cupin domain-containing protein [Eubacteriales bacterium]|nr:cupin domain-containing protein [Eubacteriales bacterium]